MLTALPEAAASSDPSLGSRIGEGAAVSTAMVPFLLAAIMVSWFGLQRRKWQQGDSDE
jgi:multiple sugar transport system permease protein